MYEGNHLARADAALREGRLLDAADAARRLIRGNTPEQAEAHRILGSALLRMGSPEDARPHLEQVHRIATHTLASCLLREGHIDRAWAIVEPTLPTTDPATLALAAEALVRLGRAGDAARMIDLSGRVDDARVAIARSQVAMVQGDPERAVDLLGRFADLAMRPAGRRLVLFQLADALDALGRYDEAFETYVQANEAGKPSHDPAATDAAIDRIIGAWTAEGIERAAGAGTGSATPVFIVGMPRSGTTLAERLLAAHARVHGGGELAMVPQLFERLTGSFVPDAPPGLIDRVLSREGRAAGGAFRDQIGSLGDGVPRVTDKNPLNFFHLGLLAALLPDARFIHCTRDPRDTALSCYFRLFHEVLAWTFDLGWIASFHASYERLMEHWRGTIDADRLLEVRYEDMVADPGGQTRRMCGFVGVTPPPRVTLDPSPAVTRTLRLDQLDAAVYASSIGRWRRYEPYVGPVLDMLYAMR